MVMGATNPDITTCPGRVYKWILVIIDHHSKYIVLRPLETKHQAEVAAVLFESFGMIGPPLIIGCDSGVEFTDAELIHELKSFTQTQKYCAAGHATHRRRVWWSEATARPKTQSSPS